MEVNLPNPCYFTINFKNSKNKIDEISNFIHYEGPLSQLEENENPKFDSVLLNVDKIQGFNVDNNFKRRSTKLGIRQRKITHRRIPLSEMDINNSFSKNI